MASAVAGGLVVSVVLLSAVAEGLVLAGGLSFGGGEATSRTKVFLGCFDFCLLVADFFLGLASAVAGGLASAVAGGLVSAVAGRLASAVAGGGGGVGISCSWGIGSICGVAISCS